MGTSKNKRAMSGGGGGKGRVSRYTKKFRKCYENFRNIAESDPNDIKNDDTKIRKMEEWGRLRGIYTYLNSKKLEGNNGTFLDKMKVNLGDNFNKYNGAVSCLENDSAILLKHGCVLEKDYVNSKESAGIPTVETKKAEEQTEEQNEKAREEVRKAQEEAEKARQDMQRAQEEAETARQDMQRATAAPSTIEGDDQSEAPVSDAPAEETPATVAEVSNDAVGQPGTDDAAAVVQSTPVGDAENDNDAEAQADNTVGQPEAKKADDEAAVEAPDADDEAVDEAPTDAEQGGGRSKRRQKSSRRRGKSMKSKKGRKTRRR